MKKQKTYNMRSALIQSIFYKDAPPAFPALLLKIKLT